MAGTDSDLPKENKHSGFEGLSFTFNYEGDNPEIGDLSNLSSEKFNSIITGNFEFARQNRFAYWRNMVPIVVLFGLISIVVYSFDLFDQKDLSASIVKAYDTNEEKVEMEVISINETPLEPIEMELLVQEDIIDSTIVVVEKIEVIAEEVKQEEKTILEKELTIVENKIVKEDLIPVAPVENISEVKPRKAKVFKTSSLAEARLLSKNTGRYIFMKFGADWCAPCKLMETTAMKDEAVLKLLKEKYILLDVNVDKNGGYKIKEEFYVEQLPTLIILDDYGNQMKREESAIGTTKLIEMLESMTPYIYLEEEELTVNADFKDGVGER